VPVALTIREAEHHLSDPGVDALVRDLGIPAQPQIVSALGQEMARPEPDLQRIVRIVASDVALTAAVLRVVNSPAYGLRRRIETNRETVIDVVLGGVGVWLLANGILAQFVS
jgi:HD-like signal output (HDOD) protein